MSSRLRSPFSLPIRKKRRAPLREVFSANPNLRKLIRSLRGVPEGALIDELSHILQVHPHELLAQAADALGLDAFRELRLPAPLLLETAGHSTERLRQMGVVPQPSFGTTKYTLVVSDPSLVDIQAYREADIEIGLGLGSAVDELWTRFETDGSGLLQADIASCLERLIRDAADFGANELYLGTPEEDGYQFYSGENLYAGRISILVFRSILANIDQSRGCTVGTDDPGITQLHLNFTTIARDPVIKCSWDAPHRDERSRPGETAIGGGRHGAAEAPRPAAKAVLTARRSPRKQSPQIFLIDDDERFSRILVLALEGQGYRVECEQSSARALTRLLNDEISPDLILCDLHMPDRDGIDVLQTLRAASLPAPVVILTSDRTTPAQIAAIKEGAQAYVRKSEDPAVLFAWIDALAYDSEHYSSPHAEQPLPPVGISASGA